MASPDRHELPAARTSVAGLLATIAADARTGVLVTHGTRPASFAVREGRVVRVDAAGTPAAEAGLLRLAEDEDRRREAAPATRSSDSPERLREAAQDLLTSGGVDAARAEVVLGRAAADAAWDTLGAFAAPATDARFLDGARTGWTLSEGFTVPQLLAEVARRDAVAASHRERVHPDEPVWRSSVLPVAAARLSWWQWDVATLAQGRTPRAMAVLLGSGVFATVLEVARLSELGLLTSRPAGEAG